MQIINGTKHVTHTSSAADSEPLDGLTTRYLQAVGYVTATRPIVDRYGVDK